MPFPKNITATVNGDPVGQLKAVAKCLQARPVGTNNAPRERWEARGVRHLAEPKVDDMSRQQTALAVNCRLV